MGLGTLRCHSLSVSRALAHSALFPIHIAANKFDVAPNDVLDGVAANGVIIPCMADVELGLRRADAANLIAYVPSENDFQFSDQSSLNEAQMKALNHMKERLKTNQGTGVARVLDTVLFDELDHIVVYPVQDELAGPMEMEKCCPMRLWSRLAYKPKPWHSRCTPI